MEASSQRNILTELHQLLHQREIANKILNKQTKVSLLTVHLLTLNRIFATYNPNEVTDKERADTIEYLRNFLTSTPALKLVHNQSTVQGAIDVSRLHCLTVLEIKKVPVHLLVGLRALRQQLQVLICTRSINSIKSLISSCGGDQAERQEWPLLHTLVLSYNRISEIDGSLELVPSLKTLDLSHNNISHTGEILECLTELQHLNLSFNSLSRIPSLSTDSHPKLKSLILRNNRIEDLTGCRAFLNLLFLDVSWNCIYTEGAFYPLKSLGQISKLSFLCNPVSYAPGYRNSVIKMLPACLRFMTIELDGKQLTDKEKKLISGKQLINPESNFSSTDNLLSHEEGSIDTLGESSSDYNLQMPLAKKKLKAKKKRVRQAYISDQNETPEFMPSTPQEGVPDIEEAQKYENMRKNLGADWLLALQNPYKSIDDPTVVQSSSEDIRVDKDAPSKHDESDTFQESESPQIVEVENKVEDQQIVDIQTREKECDATSTDASDGQQSTLVDRQDESDSASTAVNQSQNVDGSINKQNSDEGFEMVSPGSKESEHVPTAVFSVGSATLSKEDTDSYNGSRSHHRSSESDRCGPLLVLLEFKPNEIPTQMFVTVKESYIEECDLFGEEFDRLELRSLIKLQVTEQNVMFDPDESHMEIKPVLELNFDYVRNDRRRRKYILEDEDSCELLRSVLQPFVDLCEEKQKKIIMQCLKCAKEFPYEKADFVIVKSKIKGTGKGLNEVPICPSCKSTLLVEKEVTSGDEWVKGEASLSGSMSSSLDEPKPLATSSPWKERDNQPNSKTPSQKSKVSFETPKAGTTASQNETGDGCETSTSINPEWDNGDVFAPNNTQTPDSFSVALKLPDSTIPNTSVDARTPIDEVVNYPEEEFDMLLKANNAALQHRYMLVPPNLIGDNKWSRPSSESSNHGDKSPVRVLTASAEHLEKVQENTGSEDEFDVLPQTEESKRRDDNAHFKTKTKDNTQDSSLEGRINGEKHGRLSSNESDIAILNEKDMKESSNSSASDNTSDSNRTSAGKMSDKTKRYSQESRDGRESDDNSSRPTSLYGSLKESFLNWKHEGRNAEFTSSGEAKKESDLLLNAEEKFEQADHRLKLYMTMSLFSEREEFKGLIKANVCIPNTWSNPQYPALIVISSHTLYILRVMTEESNIPSEALILKQNYALGNILHIYVGLGGQTLQIEVANEGFVATLVIGDSERCERFAKLLEGVIIFLSSKSKFKGIVRKHKTLDDTIKRIRENVEPEMANVPFNLCVNVTRSSMTASSSLLQVILCTDASLVLIEENGLWPLGSNRANKPPRGKQLVMKEHAKITEVTEVKVSEEKPYRIVIYFLHEEDNAESQWDLKVASLYSLNQLIAAINKPWHELFGIQLNMTYLDQED